MEVRITSMLRKHLPKDENFWNKLKFHIQKKTFDELSLAGWIMEQMPDFKVTANDLDTLEDFTKELLLLQNSEKKIDLKFEQLRALMKV